jgi:hypothetical protein
VLHVEHHPAALYSMIAMILGVAKATLRWHSQQYRANAFFRSQTDARCTSPMLKEKISFNTSRLHMLIIDGGQLRKPNIGSSQPFEAEWKLIPSGIYSEGIRMKAGCAVPMKGSQVGVSMDDMEAYFLRLVGIVEETLPHCVFHVDDMDTKSGRTANKDMSRPLKLY